jgi:hypothetical protein
MNRDRDIYLSHLPTRGDIVDAFTKVADEHANGNPQLASAFYDLADQFMPIGYHVDRKLPKG